MKHYAKTRPRHPALDTSSSPSSPPRPAPPRRAGRGKWPAGYLCRPSSEGAAAATRYDGSRLILPGRASGRRGRVCLPTRPIHTYIHTWGGQERARYIYIYINIPARHDYLPTYLRRVNARAGVRAQSSRPPPPPPPRRTLASRPTMRRKGEMCATTTTHHHEAHAIATTG